MPCLASQEMLIQSNKMETNVFIQESQLSLESAKTSKSMQEFRHIQNSSRSLLLAFILLMLLLIGGVLGLGIWNSQEKVHLACKEVFNQVYTLANIPGEQQKYQVFKVPQNGTYFIYGKVEKEKQAMPNCQDELKLSWQRSGEKSHTIKEAIFTKDQPEVEIIAIDVYLEEDTTVHLQLNCVTADTEKTFFRVWNIWR